VKSSSKQSSKSAMISVFAARVARPDGVASVVDQHT
jgi:hypothetical protein